MKESQWLTCQDPIALLNFVGPRLSDRKQRLFACACARRCWLLLPPGVLQRAILVAERFADGLASAEELRVAMNQASVVSELLLTRDDDARSAAAKAADNCTRPSAADAADLVRANAASAAFHLATQHGFAGATARAMEYAAQCDLLREIAGNPFRPVTLARAWLTFNDGLARRVAQAIYDGEDFEDLPILADALEEAGCTDEALLRHLREDAEHVRGCWALDLILGKQ